MASLIALNCQHPSKALSGPSTSTMWIDSSATSVLRVVTLTRTPARAMSMLAVSAVALASSTRTAGQNGTNAG